MVNAAHNHVVSNACSRENGHTISGYNGPTIPQLRMDPNISNPADRYMSLLMGNIPSLAPAPNATPSIQYSAALPPTQPPVPAVNATPGLGFLRPPPAVGGGGHQGDQRGVQDLHLQLQQVAQQLELLRQQQVHDPGQAQQLPGQDQQLPGQDRQPFPGQAQQPFPGQTRQFHPLFPGQPGQPQPQYPGHLPQYPAVAPQYPGHPPQFPPYPGQPSTYSGQPQGLQAGGLPQYQGPQAGALPQLQGLQAGGFDGYLANQQVGPSLDSLFSVHIKNRQYRACDFSKLGNFSYSAQIKQSNLNLALYGYGSIKHFLALADGTLPSVDTSEYISRLQHVLNVFEIVCLGSSLSDFDSHGWKVGKEYYSKIIRDIEMGYKSWGTLDRSIDPTAWTYAKEIAPPKPSPAQAKQSKAQQPGQTSSAKLCTTWNGFKQQGCHYESNNPGETCVFQHICSKCKAKGLTKKHKAWQCTDSDPKQGQTASTSAPVTSTVTVTSG